MKTPSLFSVFLVCVVIIGGAAFMFGSSVQKLAVNKIMQDNNIVCYVNHSYTQAPLFRQLNTDTIKFFLENQSKKENE